MATERKFIDVPLDIKADDIKDDGTFSGHASLFDQDPDSHDDLVARGAFIKSIERGGRNKTGIAMLWQHRSDKMPPGVWVELKEDTKGLPVKGLLALDTQLGKEAHSIMKLGAKTGMFKFGLSIGFDTLAEEFHTPKDEEGKKYPRKIRTIKEAELWEISIVIFPAKIGAAVTDVKKIDVIKIKEAKTERELENVLREVEGLSECSTKLLVKMCKSFLREGVKAKESTLNGDILSEILDSLVKTNKSIQTAEILHDLKAINL